MRRLMIFAALLTTLFGAPAFAADITDFFGTFTGTAKITENDTTEDRDMSVTIAQTDKGFQVSWTSVISRSDGRTKENTYTILFIPTQRDDIFASAMKTNVFGKAVPLDPLKGDPYVWSRLSDDTLSVFSLLIDENGNYMVQEYHRTLAEGGLDLEYRRFRDGQALKSVNAFLAKN
ncbi:hypothetical protein [Amylibacter sp. IMCC11727]|uniref:hypothetical protein n=1 Tax=Amylibacter sp. IMCC11727 TaxID=3039851 RepID=UPI00244E5A1C|nr:hypothetical protein [Amylibacter sp. IMCC11727]WGI22612.1 hypothetical protein QBD29_04130 [Amylibacter sp. IMCC11727]